MRPPRRAAWLRPLSQSHAVLGAPAAVLMLRAGACACVWPPLLQAAASLAWSYSTLKYNHLLR